MRYVLITIRAGGCKARVIFADRDIRASEDSSHAQVTLRLDGDSGSTETVLVLVPLTVAQYRNQTNRYDGICDSIIAAAGTIDQAEGMFCGRHKTSHQKNIRCWELYILL